MATGRALRARYRIEAALTHSALALGRLIPLDLVSALGGGIGRLIGRLAPVSRVGRRNLEAAFPRPSAEKGSRTTLQKPRVQTTKH